MELHSQHWGTSISLLDLDPKLRGKISEEAQLTHLQSLMRQTCDMKRRKSDGDQYDWVIDYEFYIDQSKVHWYSSNLIEYEPSLYKIS